MDLAPTLALLAVVAALGGLCAWRGARPPNPHRGPRLIPYRFLMVLAGALVIYLCAHLLSLAGVTTGRSNF